MHTPLRTSLILAFAALAGCSSGEQTPPAAAAAPAPAAATPAERNSFAIRDVRLFDGERVTEHATVVVRDGTIVAVGVDAAVPADVAAIDGAGKTLLPGFIDAHVHAFGAARKEALRFGVTTELDMFTDWHLLADAKRERESHARTDQADLWSAGTLATVDGGHGTEYGMKIATLDATTDAGAWVDARLKEGSDYVKIVREDLSAFGAEKRMPTLTQAQVDALIAAAHARGKAAVIHVATRDDAAAAIAAGVDGLAHVFMDQPIDAATVKLAADHHTFVVPTLSVLAGIGNAGLGKALAEDAALKPYLDATQYGALQATFPNLGAKLAPKWPNALTTVAALNQAGVTILAGTDAGNPGTAHGVSLHGELRLLVQAGLTPTQALVAATSAPARAFKLDDRGRVAAGLRADLVLVDGDPTTDIAASSHIARVWKNGYPLDRTVAAAQRPNLDGAPVAPAEPLVSDFDAGKVESRYGLGWSPTSDQMAGGKSEAAYTIVADGAQGSAGALEIRGEVRDGYAYPWAGAIWFPATQAMQPMDYSARSELVFWTRGDGRRYSVLLFSGAAAQGIPSMQGFVAGPQWTQVHLKLADFPGGDVKRLRGLAFTAGAPAGAFTFALDQIEIR